MKSTKLLKTNKNKTKTKTINNHNKLKGGSNNNILSLFIPNNTLKEINADNTITKNIDFIQKQINSETSNDNFLQDKIQQLFTSEGYFNDLIKQNYNAGIEKHKTLQKMDNNNVKIVISLHGQTQSGIFKLPDNVNVVFMSPVSYISCSPPGRILNYLDNSDNLENFLKNPSCFNKNKTDSFFNQSVIVYGGQYCIDLLLSREAALGGITLSGNKEHVTGIHINNGKNFINKNTESNIESQKFKDLGIPESPNLSKDEFPEGVVNGIVYFDNNNPKESSLGLLSNFLQHFFSNENNNKKQFTIFFTSCRELDDQANKETLSFYEKTLKYLNFKIQYDNNKTKSKNKNINEEYTKCFSAPTIFSNDTTKSNTTGSYEVKFNTISHGQERKTKEQLKINKTNTKTKLKSRIKPTINDDSIIEISNLHYGYNNSKYKKELDELFNNINLVNDKKQISLKKLKEFITNKHQDDIFKLLFILLSLCFQKSIFEYDANSFDYRILDFIELTKFILNGKSISIIFEFIIYFANELKLNKISYIELINLFIDQTPDFNLTTDQITEILKKYNPKITINDIIIDNNRQAIVNKPVGFNPFTKSLLPGNVPPPPLKKPQSSRKEPGSANEKPVTASAKQALQQQNKLNLSIPTYDTLTDLEKKEYNDKYPKIESEYGKSSDIFLNSRVFSFKNYDNKVDILILQKLLKENTNIKTLKIEFLNISDLVASVISNELQNNINIENFQLLANNIGDIGASELAKIIQKPKLEVFYIKQNNIGDLAAISIANILSNNNNLQILNLYNNKIGDKGAIALAKALETNNTLHTLDLGRNNIGDEGIQSFFDLLKKTKKPNLKILNLKYNLKDDHESPRTPEIQKSIEKIKQITNILDNFTPTEIDLTGVNSFVSKIVEKALENNTLSAKSKYSKDQSNIDNNLEQILDLLKNSNIKIIDADFTNPTVTNIIAKAINNNKLKYLLELDLINCEIGDNEATSIANALLNHKKLKNLRLGQNRIGSKGIESLIKLLENNNKIQLQIDLNNPNVKDDKYMAELYKLVQIMNIINAIDTLDNYIGIGNNNMFGVSSLIDNYGATILSKFLKNNNHNHISKIKFVNSYIGDIGGKALADLLNGNTTITELILSYNQIGNDGAIALAKALINNNTLNTLDLGQNNINQDGVKEFIKILKTKKNSVLKKLTINNINMNSEMQKEINSILEGTYVQKTQPQPQLQTQPQNIIVDNSAAAAAAAAARKERLDKLAMLAARKQIPPINETSPPIPNRNLKPKQKEQLPPPLYPRKLTKKEIENHKKNVPIIKTMYSREKPPPIYRKTKPEAEAQPKALKTGTLRKKSSRVTNLMKQFENKGNPIQV
jgi:Ran GTPase-activating protein (RanGAP) involved in mRNA processing and transport